jgi:co-chaperonin GroES (HSP10)|tara:strand:- start:50 stop:472 length:423 start_codon:yes stop_codon:yes gene_type:complete
MQVQALNKAIQNDQWITGFEEDIPDPEVLPDIPGFHVLVRPISVKPKTKGGIFLPDSTRDDIAYLTTVGKVLKVGDQAYKDANKFTGPPWCETDDYVCYGKNAGIKLHYKGIKLLLLYDDQIIMRVENPKDLDPTFNLSS